MLTVRNNLYLPSPLRLEPTSRLQTYDPITADWRLHVSKVQSISTRDLLAFCSPNLRPPSLTSDAIITDTSPSFHLAISTPQRQGTSTSEPLTSSQLLSQPSRTELTLYSPLQMLSRAATRTTTSLVTKRGFQTTRARMSSPYHYPEGAYSNIPFNPRSKWFGLGYWTFMATGFFAPFGIAGAWFPSRCSPVRDANELRSLPDLQAPVNYSPADWICCLVERLGSLEVECGVNNRNRHQSFSTLDSKFHLFDNQLYRTIRDIAIMIITSYAIPSQPDLYTQNSRAPGYYSKLKYMVVQNLLLHHNLVPSFLYLRYDGPSH